MRFQCLYSGVMANSKLDYFLSCYFKKEGMVTNPVI